MENKFTIDKGIPFPKGKKITNKFDFINEMDIGDSFLCTVQERASLYSYKAKGIFNVKSAKEGEKIRIWKINIE